MNLGRVKSRPLTSVLICCLIISSFSLNCSPSLQVAGKVPSDNLARGGNETVTPKCNPQDNPQLASLPIQRQLKPEKACYQLWQVNDSDSKILNFDFSTDTNLRESPYSCITGNFGYPNYQRRLKLFLQQTRGLAEPDSLRNGCFKDLTVLVYMAADNDLNSYAFWDLFEMESPYSRSVGGSQLYTDVLVELDSAGPHGRRRVHIFQTPGETKNYHEKIKELEKSPAPYFENANFDKILSPVVEELPESLEDHDLRFFDFIRWGMHHYPSSHYLVIVWGHGQNNISSDGIGTIALDNNGNQMTISQLAHQMARIKNEVLGKNIDVYAADACLMQNIESTTSLAPYTDYLVGSTQIQSSLGFNYRVIFKRINDLLRVFHRKKSFSDSEIAKSKRLSTCGYDVACWFGFEFSEVTNSSSRHRNGQFAKWDTKAQHRFTISSLKSKQLITGLVPTMNQLGFLLRSYFENNPTEARVFLEQLRFNSDFNNPAISLKDVLQLLKEQIASRQHRNLCSSDDECLLTLAAIKEAEMALRDTTLNSYSGDYYRSSGSADLSEPLSIWLPKSDLDFQRNFEKIENSLFFELSPGWTAFLFYLSKLGVTP